MKGGRCLLPKKLSGLWNDRSGGVFIYVAIAAPVLIGLAGASIDVGLWYANKRLAQSAVDSAAQAGALELRRSDGDTNAIIAAVNLDAAINGYSAGNGDTIVVDTSNSPRVAVTITRSVPGLLSQVVFTEQTNVAARAVARADVNDSCIWSMNLTAAEAVKVSGSAQVNLSCGVIANSGDANALYQEGSGCLNATELKVAGGYSADCMDPPAPETGIDPVDDPLAALAGPPGPYTCDYSGNDGVFNGNVGPPITLNPGVYCGNGIKINTNRPVTFNPGLYILDGAPFTIGGQASVTGTDVSFYLTQNGGPNDDITIAGGATVTLSASSDELPGVLFYHDRNAGSNITHTLTGGSSMQLNGILYFPSTDVAFTGGSSLNESAAVIIADEVTFTGEVWLGDFDGSSILGNALLLQATLVE